MSKGNCKYAKYAGDVIECMITKQLCGNVKFCRAERRWKNNECAVNCTIPLNGGKPNERKSD